MTPDPRPSPGDAGSQKRWGLDGLAVGISLGGITGPEAWQRQLAWIERADALGVHSAWLPEMHFTPGACTTPLTTLAAFAACSQHLRLGTTSLLLPIHEPLRLAAEVSALQALSGDRAILGLGRGFRRPLFEAFEIPVKAKRDRFDEHLEIMLGEWPQGPPPMGVAAFGRKGLEQAARHGLPYLASPIETLDLVAENLAFHRDHLPPEIDADTLAVPMLRSVFVAGDDREAAGVFGAMEREARGLVRGPVPKALSRAAEAPLEERVLVGSVQRVADEIGRYRDRVGLDLLIARVEVPGAETAQREESLGRLVEEVLPLLA